MMFLSLIRNPAGMNPVICEKYLEIKASNGSTLPTTEAFIHFNLS
jgi:hypothetical protein